MENKSLIQFDDVFDFDSNILGCPTQSVNQRLSLAYGQLDAIPGDIISQIAQRILFLDLSYNGFRNLSFLAEFENLQTLILDRNFNIVCSTLPLLPNLEVLWLNNCNLINIGDWLQQLQVQCPNLRQLSMMCNPVGQTRLNGVTDDEEFEYRQQVIKMLPQLHYFDGVSITDAERRHSEESVLSVSILEDVFRRKLRAFMDLSTRFQMLRTISFKTKQATSR